VDKLHDDLRRVSAVKHVGDEKYQLDRHDALIYRRILSGDSAEIGLTFRGLELWHEGIKESQH
jgi:hypothetical protein